MQATSSRSLLFGGFAYNAVSFMFRPIAMFSGIYLIGMSLSFLSALYVLVVSNEITSKYETLSTDKQKSYFVVNMEPVMRRVQVGSIAYLGFFLGAFLCMGYIKLWTYDDIDEVSQVEYSYYFGWVQLFGAIGGFVGIGYLMRTIAAIGEPLLAESAEEMETLGRRTRAATSDDLGDQVSWTPSQRSTSTGSGGISFQDHQASFNLIADATTFQTGNVFYEILFSAISMFDLGNYGYFTLSVITLIIGTLVLVQVTLLTTWSTAIRSRCSKHAVKRWLLRTGGRRSSLSFLYTASLITWQCSMLFSSYVKYQTMNNDYLPYLSTIWSVIGLTMMMIGGCMIYRLDWTPMMESDRGTISKDAAPSCQVELTTELLQDNSNVDDIKSFDVGSRQQGPSAF